MNATAIIASIRDVRRSGSMDYVSAAALRNLEIDIAGTETEDFTCDMVGYDTVLSHLSKTNPEAVALMPNPVHDTISDGIALARLAWNRGIEPIKVAACEHMQRRFPKARHVNAYPTKLLEEFYA